MKLLSPACRCSLFISSLEALVCISSQLKGGRGCMEIMLLVETSGADDKQNLFLLHFYLQKS